MVEMSKSVWVYISLNDTGSYISVAYGRRKKVVVVVVIFVILWLWLLNVVEYKEILDYVHFVYGKLMICLKKMEMCAQTEKSIKESKREIAFVHLV